MLTLTELCCVHGLRKLIFSSFQLQNPSMLCVREPV
jgi:hypothetical protein